MEAIEQQMVGNLQHTMARKNDAYKTLQDKSKSLKKSMEPRKAYKYATKDMSQQGSDPAMRTMQAFRSPSQSSMNNLNNLNSPKFVGRSKSIAPTGPASGNINNQTPLKPLKQESEQSEIVIL